MGFVWIEFFVCIKRGSIWVFLLDCLDVELKGKREEGGFKVVSSYIFKEWI